MGLGAGSIIAKRSLTERSLTKVYTGVPLASPHYFTTVLCYLPSLRPTKMNIEMLPNGATKDETINTLTFLSLGAADLMRELLDVQLQDHHLEEIRNCMRDLMSADENVHRLWPTICATRILTSVNFSRAPRLIHRHVEVLTTRIKDLKCSLEYVDYSEVLEDMLSNFNGVLDATLQLQWMCMAGLCVCVFTPFLTTCNSMTKCLFINSTLLWKKKSWLINKEQ